jgi:hypothetical protein
LVFAQLNTDLGRGAHRESRGSFGGHGAVQDRLFFLWQNDVLACTVGKRIDASSRSSGTFPSKLLCITTSCLRRWSGVHARAASQATLDNGIWYLRTRALQHSLKIVRASLKAIYDDLPFYFPSLCAFEQKQQYNSQRQEGEF